MANYYDPLSRTPSKQDIAFTVEQWAIADEPRQFAAHEFAPATALSRQLHDIVEIEMPNKWSAFQAHKKNQNHVGATQMLLNLTFDSRRAVMCQSLARSEAHTAANVHSRQVLHDAIREANLEEIMFFTFDDNYMNAIRWTNIGVSIDEPKGVASLVKRVLGLTCSYVDLRKRDPDYFFPAPNRDNGVYVPYDEFEQYRG